MHAWRLQRHRFCLPHPLYLPCLLCLPSSGVPILRQRPLPQLAGDPHFATVPLTTVLTGKTSAIFVGLLLFIFYRLGLCRYPLCCPVWAPAFCRTSIGRYKGAPCTRHGYPGFFSCCRCVGKQLLLGLGPFYFAVHRPYRGRPAGYASTGVRWGYCPFTRGRPKPDKAAPAPQAICFLGPWRCGCPAQKISFCPAGTFGRKRYCNASKMALPPAQPALPCHGPHGPPAGGRLCTAPKKGSILWLAAFLFPVMGNLRPRPGYFTLPGTLAGFCTLFLPCVGWGEKRFSCGFLLLFTAPAIPCRCPARAHPLQGFVSAFTRLGASRPPLPFCGAKK